MRSRLIDLKGGTRFRVPELQIEAELVRVNDCTARVRILRGERQVMFVAKDGTEREFTAKDAKVVSWSPFVVVDVIELGGADGDVLQSESSE